VPTGRLVRLHTALHPEAPETGGFCSILWVVDILLHSFVLRPLVRENRNAPSTPPCSTTTVARHNARARARVVAALHRRPAHSRPSAHTQARRPRWAQRVAKRERARRRATLRNAARTHGRARPPARPPHCTCRHRRAHARVRSRRRSAVVLHTRASQQVHRRGRVQHNVAVKRWKARRAGAGGARAR
jgi:hypothetical protein